MPAIRPPNAFQIAYERGEKWITSERERLLNKFDKLKSTSLGYSRIQPVRIAKGISSMFPDSTQMDEDNEVKQFHPNLRRKSSCLSNCSKRQ